MKIQRKGRLLGALAALCLIVSLGRFATAAEQIVLVTTVLPIEVQKSVQTGAKFQELTQAAMQYGMSDVVINGRVTFAPQEDNTVRSTVTWDSISMEAGGRKLSEPLSTPLESKVRTPQSKEPAQNRIETGTTMKAKGDIQTLAEALGRLKAQLDAKNKPEIQKNEKVERTAVTPVVASSQDSGSDSSSKMPDSSFNTVVEAGTVTTSAKCPERFIDYDKMKAVAMYRPVYTKSGVKTGEGICSPNYAEAIPIQKKDGDCTYKFDFTESKAIKGEQWYYVESNATEVLVGSCRDSNSTFPLTESRTGCPVTTDLANMVVFPQSKVVFTEGSVEHNATECRAITGATGIPLQEEYCDPMYEHDFVNGVSYLRTRIYYLSDVDGSKIYVNECGRSSKISFPHVQDTTGCGWVMDDENMLAKQQGKTIIKTGAVAGDVVVEECHTVATLNYTFVGSITSNAKFTENATFTFPANATNFSALLVGPGQQGNYSYGSQSYTDTCIVSAGNGGKAGEYKVASLQNPSKGEIVTISFVPNKENSVQFRGVTNRALVGTGGAGTATAYGDPNLMCENQWGKAKTEPGQSGYTSLGRFGLNDSSDLPYASPTLYGFGFGGTGHCQGGGTCPYGIGSVKFPDPGVVILEYQTSKYMRPDGTTFVPGQ